MLNSLDYRRRTRPGTIFFFAPILTRTSARTAPDGEFADKPGVMHIAPGATEVLGYRISVRYDFLGSD